MYYVTLNYISDNNFLYIVYLLYICILIIYSDNNLIVYSLLINFLNESKAAAHLVFFRK